MKKITGIKDIFEGNEIQAWEDEVAVYVNFMNKGITVSFWKEEWKEVKTELSKVLKCPLK